jgi:hypothetical protein
VGEGETLPEKLPAELPDASGELEELLEAEGEAVVEVDLVPDLLATDVPDPSIVPLALGV